MKHLTESILGGTRAVIKQSNESIKAEIVNWILENYATDKTRIKISENPDKDGLYVVDILDKNYYIEIQNYNIESLTNGLFKFGKAEGGFWCNYCDKLTSLEGAPKKVGGVFCCTWCDNLISLKGAPEVTDTFNCEHCPRLKSLEGSPEKVNIFSCRNCISLKNLVGGPKIVSDGFDCECCNELKSLKGAPKEVGGNFYCSNCDKLKDLSELDKIKIGGEIFK